MSTAETPVPRRPAAGKRAVGVLGVVVSVATIIGLVWWASKQQAPDFPTSGSHLAALAGAILLYFVACAIRGERWQVLLVENHAHPRRADSYGLIAVGYLGNNVLPARAGDALRVVLMAPRAKTDARTVIGTLVAERICDVLVLGAMFVFLAYGLLSGAGTDIFGNRLAEAAIVFAALAVAVIAAVLALYRTGHLDRVLAFVKPMATATRRLVQGRHGIEVLALTVAVWACEGLVWYLTAVAADLGVDFVEALYLLALSSMLVLIPAGPGYAGTMDAAVVLGSKALGKSSKGALTYLILLRFVLMVPITIAGLILGATRYGGVRTILRRVRSAP